MKNTVIAAFTVALGLAFTASAHAAGKTLAEIHGAAFPEASGWVKKDQCMKCHGSYEDLEEDGRSRTQSAPLAPGRGELPGLP